MFCDGVNHTVSLYRLKEQTDNVTTLEHRFVNVTDYSQPQTHNTASWGVRKSYHYMGMTACLL